MNQFIEALKAIDTPTICKTIIFIVAIWAATDIVRDLIRFSHAKAINPAPCRCDVPPLCSRPA